MPCNGHVISRLFTSTQPCNLHTWGKNIDFSKVMVTHFPNMAEILTQWDFHRVQEHLKRSLSKEVMTVRSWRSHMNRPALSNLPFPASPFQPNPIPTALQRKMVGILTQWAFHRVQEHLKRSSDEEVMTVRSWRSHMNRQPYPPSPIRPALPGLPFSASSSTHCPPQAYGWNIDSMGFP